MDSPYKIGHNDILGRKPCNDAEVAQSRHEQTGEKVPSKGTEPDIEEEVPAGHFPSIGDCILRLVHCCKHCGGHESAGPDHAWWSNEVAPCQTGESIPKDLR